MNLYLIWKYKYWIAIAVLSFICVGQLAYTNHLAGNLKKAEIQCQQKIQKFKDDQQKELIKAQDKANQTSADYEKLKSEQRVKNEVLLKKCKKSLIGLYITTSVLMMGCISSTVLYPKISANLPPVLIYNN